MAHDQDREIVRDGVYGKESQWAGFWGEPGIVWTTTHLSATGSTKTAALAAYAALVKQLVTVVDDFGSTRTNIMVKSVRPVETKPMAYASDSAVARLVCVWELEDWSTG